MGVQRLEKPDLGQARLLCQLGPLALKGCHGLVQHATELGQLLLVGGLLAVSLRHGGAVHFLDHRGLLLQLALLLLVVGRFLLQSLLQPLNLLLMPPVFVLQLLNLPMQINL